VSDDINILLADEIQLLDFGESRSIGPWIKLRLNDPDQLAVFRGMDTATAKKTGHIMNLVLSQGDIAAMAEDDRPADYGMQAQVLYRSTFLTTPAVWEATGTDEQFLAWVRLQKCAKCGGMDWYAEIGEGRCEAAHVRRVANGSGASIKPPYSAIPLCNKHHGEQHQHGEGDKEWFDRQRIKHLRDWAWHTLKATLGAESFRDIDPRLVAGWAEVNGVDQYLPSGYVPHTRKREKGNEQ